MAAKSIHVVIWLPSDFYSAVVSTLVEMFQLVNDVCGSQVLSCEFVSGRRPQFRRLEFLSLRRRNRPEKWMC